MNKELVEKLRELKFKAAVMLAAEEQCLETGGHIFGNKYYSNIVGDYRKYSATMKHVDGDSYVCLRCGIRGTVDDFIENGKRTRR